MADYQLLVIGAGPGGYVAALHGAKKGLKTAVIENREVGGTCLNRGCIPTKTLLHAAEIVQSVKKGEKMGIAAENIRIDLPALFARKREVCLKLSGGIESLFKTAKIDLLHGTGTILESGKVLLKEAEEKRIVTAENIIIATGSAPARPPIPGLDLPGVMTSDELLEGSDIPYASLVIIGGGVIGVELAAFYAEIGTKVTIMEGLDRLLPNMDRELGQNLSMILKRKGISVYTDAIVSGIETADEGLTVHFSSKGKDTAVTGEKVLCAVGRRPNTEGLFADGLSVEMEGRAIRTSDRYETSLPRVYAIGDVASRIQLAHYASAQGRDCVEKIVDGTEMTDLHNVPACIYCSPEIACVGLTADEAKAERIETAVGKYVMFSNGKTVICEGDRGFIKIVANKHDHKIIGAQLMCEHATDMIAELGTAVVNGLTAEQMRYVMRPHPTFEEGVGEALDALIDKLNA